LPALLRQSFAKAQQAGKAIRKDALQITSYRLPPCCAFGGARLAIFKLEQHLPPVYFLLQNFSPRHTTMKNHYFYFPKKFSTLN